MFSAEEEEGLEPRQHAELKQQGAPLELVNQQRLMQHAGQEPDPEAAASAGRADAAQDDASLVRKYPFSQDD